MSWEHYTESSSTMGTPQYVRFYLLFISFFIPYNFKWFSIFHAIVKGIGSMTMQEKQWVSIFQGIVTILETDVPGQRIITESVVG